MGGMMASSEVNGGSALLIPWVREREERDRRVRMSWPFSMKDQLAGARPCNEEKKMRGQVVSLLYLKNKRIPLPRSLLNGSHGLNTHVSADQAIVVRREGAPWERMTQNTVVRSDRLAT